MTTTEHGADTGVAGQDVYTFPLSSAQQMLWLAAQMGADGPVYHVPSGYRLRGPLDARLLARALEQLVARHEVLRTTFAVVDGEPAQVVHPEAEFALRTVDLARLLADTREGALADLVEEEARRPFDLVAGPLFRAVLFRLAADEHVLLVTAHHLVWDGWSESVFLGELGALYAALAAGDEAELDELAIQYGDYSVWEHDALEAEAPRLVEWWRERLAGAPQALTLPGDPTRPAEADHAGAVHAFRVSADVAARLAAVAREEDASLYPAVLAGFAALLHRLGGDAEVLVGAPVANRPQVELEALIGAFVNTVVLRVDLAGDPPFRELLRRARNTVHDAQEHQELPFEKLVSELAPRREPGRTPFFQVMLSFADASAGGGAPMLGPVAVEPFAVATGTAKFDLLLSAEHRADGLACVLEYATALFDAAAAERLCGHLAALLASAAAAPDLRLSELEILGADERRALVGEWSGAGETHPVALPLHRAFEARAFAHPDAVAVTFEGESGSAEVRKCGSASDPREGQRTPALPHSRTLTYGELNAQANRLARRLRALGVGPESRVGLAAERTPGLVAGILAILKAGGAYVPLDPAYPAERLAYVAEDAGVRVVLADARFRDLVPGVQVVALDDDWAGEPADDLDVAVDPAGLAYVIYTSGSTGRPKGVGVTHANVGRLFACTDRHFGFGEGDVWTLFHSYAFDFSVWELWGALLYGGRLVVVPTDVSRDPAAFHALLAREGVTVLNQTPSAFRALIPADAAGEALPALRWVVFGGEALEPASLRGWFERHGDEQPRLVNMYGITETTVHVTYREVTAEDAAAGGSSPIGVAIPDLRTYLLDAHGRPVPVGIGGELHVGGGGVARGYLGRPALTAERFVPDPFSGVPGARLYRSGDLARWTEVRKCESPKVREWNGSAEMSEHSRTAVPALSHSRTLALEYLGRIDQQVKVRGFRIEPGEVEAALLAHPSVREAAVVAREDAPGETRLVAYLVAEGEPPAAGVLRAFMAQGLPDHMLPAAFVALERLPLTPNGKLDRRALPAPEAGRLAADGAYVAPRGPMEETLAAVWASVLNVDQVGVNDNFYALGGDSIRILRVVSAARERGIPLTIRDVARNPTVAALAALPHTGSDGGDGAVHTEPFSLISAEDRAKLPEGVVDAYPLARTQLGMLYHREQNPDLPLYHTLDSWRFRMPVDEAAFQAACVHVAARHPNLRTGFDLESYVEPLQLVWGEAAFPVGLHDLRHLSTEEQDRIVADFCAAEQARPFELARPPQLRFHLHRRTDDVVQFTLVENHALFDGWSLHTILAEVLTCYLALQKGEPLPELAPLATTYRDFIALERRAIESPEARSFWASLLEGYEPVTLPRLPDAGTREGGRVGRFDYPLRASVLRGLRALAREQAVPLKSVLLAAHVKVVSLLAGRDDVVTGLSTNGRPETADGENVAGLFLNTLPFRAPAGAGTWAQLVRRVHDAELAMLSHRRYPLTEIQAGRGGATLFDASFVYLNFHVIADHMRSGEMEVLGADTMVEETNFTLMTSFQHRVGDDRRVVLSVECDRHLLTDAQIDAIRGLYRRILREMADHPSARHDRFAPLADGERNRMLTEWSAGEGSSALAEPLHRLVARHAVESPDAPCLVASAGALSYAEVDARATALAARLQSLGVGSGGRVAVVMDRVPEAIVALLAAWKAGAAYVPVDPTYPPERIAWMLRDAGASAAVTLERWQGFLAGVSIPVLALDVQNDRTSDDVAAFDEPAFDPAALAYLVYTSGTTGRPKGVMVEHAQVMEYTGAVLARLGVPDGAAWLLVSTFAADLGNTAVFPALATGGALHVASEREATDPAELAAFLAAHPVDVMKVVPSHLRALLAHEHAERLLPRTHLVLGGDASDWGLATRVRELAPACRVFNHYGPTETTVGVVAGELDPSSAADRPDAPPLGRMLGHARGYVLDAHGHPTLPGTPGELFVGGAGVARGYLGRAALTAERFLPDPFAVEPGMRMYRTGDRARFLSDGRLEFLGRADQQVKVRGYRVEPREVETVLRLHPSVDEAIVAARADAGENRLVAWVVPCAGSAIVEADLRRFLEDHLPKWMVPAAFVPLDALPLTVNGKVDRARLPDPGAAPESTDDALPRTEIEAKLAEIFAAVLKVERVGVHDGFLELGGNSIMAILLAARARKAFGVPLAVDTLLQAQTVAGLAGSIEMALQAESFKAAPPVVALPRDGELPLSFAQQRLWFTTLLDPESPAHNLPFTLRLRGALDAAAWRRALEEIVARHEVLRARFPTVDGEPRQEIDAPGSFAVREVDLRGLPEAEREAMLIEHARREAWDPFDLETGPLVRAALIRAGDEDYGAVIAFHHIVFDGWSAGVLMGELAALYSAFAAGETLELPPLPVQYADFAAWQRAQLDDTALAEQLAWWAGKLGGVPVLALPTDHPRPDHQSYRGANEAAAFPAELVDALRAVSRREGVTLFMTLLAGYATLLAHHAGQDDFAVGSPVVVGRDREELAGVIGLFLNSLPLRVDLSGGPTFRDLLLRVRRTALEAYGHQDVPFEKVVEALRIPRDAGRTPVFQVWFNHSNVPGGPLALDGVEVDGLDVGDPTIKFDLRLATEEAADGRLAVFMGYNADLFEAATAARLLAQLQALLTEAAARPDAPLAELHALLDQSERGESARRADARGDSLRRHLKDRRRAVEAGD